MKFLFIILALAALSGCMTMEEYRASYCNYDASYKQGMNDAQQGQPMDTAASAACAPAQRAATERGYREGYTTYLQNAPRQVEVNVGQPGYVEPFVPVGPGGSVAVEADPLPRLRPIVSTQCQFSTDCRGSKFCRDRGDGVHLCLGGEFRGGFCEFSGDCGGGLFCRHFDNGIGRCM